MRVSRPALHPVALAAFITVASMGAMAQMATAPSAEAKTLSTVNVNASADASAEGLSAPYAGGQVARGGRAGVLGTRDNMETPFSITAYTNELIQDRRAKSVGDVLQNDPTVRVARGFGNFQESYFIRGFVLSSDDTAYNGLYGLLPRQYIATELFERVEVLRGASTFLTGATPSGGGIGGTINLVPKRALNEPLSRVTVGVDSGGQGSVALDLSRRFGPDNSTGIRVNAAYRDGGTAIDNEKAELGLLAVGLDWRSRNVRLSGDIGWQDNRLKQTRPNVTLSSAVTKVPDAPDASSNFAQPWSYSNERDLFGTLRGEVDITPDVTAWGAYGIRRSEEANSLANLTVTNGSTGAGTIYRFDNTREDSVGTGEAGVRGKLRTGSVGHEWLVSASFYDLKKDNAYAMDYLNTKATNLYTPTSYALPAYGSSVLLGNKLSDPALQGKVKLTSFAIGDTLSFMDDSLLLTLGARRQTLEQTNYAYNTGAVSSSYDHSHTSPAAGVVFKLNKQTSFYGNYIEALIPGETAPSTAPNGAPVTNRGTWLAPYVSKQKEIGVKYDGGSLGGNLAFFSTEKPRGATNSANVYGTYGEDKHQGLELTVFGTPTRGVRLLGGGTWLDAKQKSTGVASTEGKRVIGVPEFQANIGAEWDVPGVRGLAVDGRVVYTGSSYADAANTLKVPDWTRLDLGVRYVTELSGRLVTLRARVDNVADKNYWASVGGYPGNGYLNAGAPRTFGLSAAVEF